MYRLITHSHDRWYNEVQRDSVSITSVQLTVTSDCHYVESLDSIQAILSALPEMEKYVVQMHDMFDFSYSEIAEKLALSKSQARNIHLNGLRILRERLM
jgi:DNA-directed RNA polymerase specialized sigma24 family protein